MFNFFVKEGLPIIVDVFVSNFVFSGIKIFETQRCEFKSTQIIIIYIAFY